MKLLVPVVAMVDDVGDSRVADLVSLVRQRRPSDKHHVQSHDRRLEQTGLIGPLLHLLGDGDAGEYQAATDVEGNDCLMKDEKARDDVRLQDCSRSIVQTRARARRHTCVYLVRSARICRGVVNEQDNGQGRGESVAQHGDGR